MRIQRNRHVYTDGHEEESIHVSVYSLKSPDEVERLGHELLEAAAEWRAEIETRGLPGPPTFKTFDFIHNWGGGCRTVASWVEHPWALVRYGSGTSIAFLVKEDGNGRFSAWRASVKFENGEHRWKCRYSSSDTILAHELLHIFPYVLPDSPTLGDIELAREKVRASRSAA